MADDMTRIIQAVGSKNITVIVLPASKYEQWIMSLSAIMSSMFSRICFVSLIKPDKVWIKEFKQYTKNYHFKIEDRKFFFVDGVQEIYTLKGERTLLGNIAHPKDAVKGLVNSMTSNHVFLHTLTDYNKVYQTIMNAVWTKKSEVLFVDSLTLLSQYMSVEQMVRMMHAMASRLDAFNCKAVFPYLIDKKSENLLKQMRVLVDDIIVIK